MAASPAATASSAARAVGRGSSGPTTGSHSPLLARQGASVSVDGQRPRAAGAAPTASGRRESRNRNEQADMNPLEPDEEAISSYKKRAEFSMRRRCVVPFVMALVTPAPLLGLFFPLPGNPSGQQTVWLLMTGLLLAMTWLGASAEHHYAAALGLRVSPWRVLLLGARGFVDPDFWRKSIAPRLLALVLLPLALGWFVHGLWRIVSGNH